MKNTTYFFIPTLMFVACGLLLTSCGNASIPTTQTWTVEKPTQRLTTESKAVAVPPDYELDRQDTAYQYIFDMNMSSVISMLPDEYYFKDGMMWKYFIQSASWICMSIQQDRLNAYLKMINETNEYLKNEPKREYYSQPETILSTDSCSKGWAYKTGTWYQLYTQWKISEYSTAVRVRNKLAANFDGEKWEKMSVAEIRQALKEWTGTSDNPRYWYKVNVSASE